MIELIILISLRIIKTRQIRSICVLLLLHLPRYYTGEHQTSYSVQLTDGPFMIELTPFALQGNLVRLVPMEEAHAHELAEVALAPEIWQHMVYGHVDTEEKLRAFMRELLERQAQGTDLCFTVLHRQSGKPVGCTRYMNIDVGDRGLEIGGTFYGPAYQRTGVNTECKYLLLRHAFEVWGCIRVQLKTDLVNTRSQAAIERIGAVKEGVLRNHMVLPSGRIRHSVMYSIIDSEWSDVKARLEGLMGR
jgi:RimJ/RimL family protein N-acetyltransferase